MIATLEAPEATETATQEGLDQVRELDEALTRRVAQLRELDRTLTSHETKLAQAEKVLHGLINRIHGKLDDLIAVQARGEHTADRIEAAVSLATQQIDWIEQAGAALDETLSERVEGIDAVAREAFEALSEQEKQRFRRCLRQFAGRTKAGLKREVECVTQDKLDDVQADAQRIKDELIAAFEQVDDGTLDRMTQLRHDVDRLTETLKTRQRRARNRKLKP